MFTGRSKSNIPQAEIQAVQQFATYLDSGMKAGKAYAKTIANCSEATQQYVKNGFKAGQSAKEMANGLKAVDTGARAAAVGANLLNAALTVGISMAMAVLLPKLIEGFDRVINKTKYLQQSVDYTQGKIESLQSEIKELEAIDYRTSDQQNRLNDLREELSLQEQILQIEEKRVLNSKYRSDLTANFDNNTWTNKYLKDTSSQLTTLNNGDLQKLNILIDKKLNQLQKRKDWYNQFGTEWLTRREDQEAYLLKNKQFEDDIADLQDKKDLILGDIYAQAKEYQSIIDQMQKDIASGNLTGSSLKEANELVEKYNKLLDQYQPLMKEWEDRQKKLGTYDYSSVIASTFEHVEFKGLQDKLVELAQDEKLSPELLTQDYKALCDALLEAGVDADMDTAKSPLPPALQKIQPRVPRVPSRLGQVIWAFRAIL